VGKEGNEGLPHGSTPIFAPFPSSVWYNCCGYINGLQVINSRKRLIELFVLSLGVTSLWRRPWA